MKERGMLFSKPMVLALLDGSKTQTRRILKGNIEGFDLNGLGNLTIGNKPLGYCAVLRAPKARWIADDKPWHEWIKCPYGKPGDRIWVRENFQPIYAEGWNEGKNDETGDPVNYKTGEGYDVSYPATDGIVEFYDSETDECSQRVWPSIHMPRWASRIDLEITGVRVERLQDISDQDARAEGCQPAQPFMASGIVIPGQWRHGYQDLWEAINGAGSWDENPWVWVVEFRRIKP
jgi:hypothetical protein